MRTSRPPRAEFGNVQCEHADLTHQDVADIMTSRGFPMTKQAVRWFEMSAFRKLREHPEVRALAQEIFGRAV